MESFRESGRLKTGVSISMSAQLEMEMMFTRKGSPASLRRKLDMHFKILSLDLDGNLTFIQKRLRVGRLPSPKCMLRGKRKHF